MRNAGIEVAIEKKFNQNLRTAKTLFGKKEGKFSALQ